MDAAGLITQIETAFPAQPLPSMTLRQALLADQSLTRTIPQSEWDGERRRDGDISWLDLSDTTLVECDDGVAHLDEQSFAYYLGALLRFAVNHISAGLPSAEGDLIGTVVFSVTNRSNYNLGRLKRLSDAQIDCVIEFLRFVEKNSEIHGADASKALKLYWLTPEARQRTIIHAP